MLARGPPGARDLAGPGAAGLLVTCSCPVLGEDVSRNPAAFFDLKPLCLSPGAYLGVADAARGSLAPVLAWPPGRAGNLPAGVGIAGQGCPQFLGVLGTQVNLVLLAVQPETDRVFCFAAIKVVDEEGLYFLGHACLRSCRFRYPIVRHMSLACGIRWLRGMGAPWNSLIFPIAQPGR